MRADFIGVILIGGQSRRMGQDKSLMHIKGGSTQREFLFELLTPLVEQVVYSSREGQKVRGASIVDKQAELGPAGGILSVAKSFPKKKLLVLPCDLAGLQAEDLNQLMGASQGFDAVAFEGQTLEPLPSVWSARALSKLAHEVDHGRRGLINTLEKVNTKVVPLNHQNWIQINDSEALEKVGGYL